MKKWGIFIAVACLLVLVLFVSPVLAKDPGPPEKGVLFEAIESLQQQVDELQAQVDEFAEADPTVDESVKNGVDWSELSGIPADIADGDDDTHLTEAQVDAFVADNGYATSAQLPKLGEAVEKSFDTFYTAETDGFVIASTIDWDVPETYAGIIGSVNSDIFCEDISTSTTQASGASIAFPVMKDDVWYVHLAAGDAPYSSVWWIPFGN